MLYKCLERHIIREDSLSSLRHTAVGAGSVSCGRVKLGKKETSLRSTCIANDESRERESVLNEFLKFSLDNLSLTIQSDMSIYPCIFLWLLKKSLEVFIALLILVSCFSPLRNCFSMKDKNVEERIEK